MHFKINVSLNIDTNHSLKMGNRTARIRHERREHGFTNNPSINPNLSKYNRYHNFYDFKNAMDMTLKPYVEHHNNLKSVKKNPDRKITDLHKFIMKRGKRIPYRYVVGKMGTGKDTKALRNLFHKHNYTDKDFYKAFNQTAYEYGKEFNKLFSGNNKKDAGLSFDHLDTNVDETRRHGANHFHAGILSHATTKKGKTSLSFDRAIHQIYGGTSNISAWSIMRNKEDHRFLRIATKNFQKYLGKDFQFELHRNPHSSSGMAHNDFIKTKTEQDKYTQQSKAQERNSIQSLKRQNRSLINQNKQYKILVQSLSRQNEDLTKQAVSEIEIQEADKSATSLMEQNRHLKSQLQKLSHNFNQLKSKYQTLLNQVHGLAQVSKAIHGLGLSNKQWLGSLEKPNSSARKLFKNILVLELSKELKKKSVNKQIH